MSVEEGGGGGGGRGGNNITPSPLVTENKSVILPLSEDSYWFGRWYISVFQTMTFHYSQNVSSEVHILIQRKLLHCHLTFFHKGS